MCLPFKLSDVCKFVWQIIFRLCKVVKYFKRAYLLLTAIIVYNLTCNKWLMNKTYANCCRSGSRNVLFQLHIIAFHFKYTVELGSTDLGATNISVQPIFSWPKRKFVYYIYLATTDTFSGPLRYKVDSGGFKKRGHIGVRIISHLK